MQELYVGFKKLEPHAIIPTKAHATDSGFDLYASERTVIQPEQTLIVKTDIAAILPPYFDASIRPRSGITSSTALRVQLGTIDNAYRGELGIIMDNINVQMFDEDGELTVSRYYRTPKNEMVRSLKEVFPDGTYVIERGDKIAQLVVQPLPPMVAIEVYGDIDSTDRGTGGFGSTGVNAAS